MRFNISLLIILCLALLGGSQIGEEVKQSELDSNNLSVKHAFQNEFIQPMGKRESSISNSTSPISIKPSNVL